MKRYSAERKAAVMQRMMPPHNTPIPALAAEAQHQMSSDFVPVIHAPQAEGGGLSLVLPNGLVLQGIAADNLPVVYQLLSRLS